MLKNKFIIFIGNISFELFLIHLLVIRYNDKLVEALNIHILQSNNYLKYLLDICVAIVLAYLWKYAFEKMKKNKFHQKGALL